jgi:hypothetical protein
MTALKEDVHRCQLCSTLIGEGFRISKTELYVCLECWSVIEAILKDALSETLRQIMDDAEDPVRNELQPYFTEEEE